MKKDLASKPQPLLSLGGLTKLQNHIRNVNEILADSAVFTDMAVAVPVRLTHILSAAFCIHFGPGATDAVGSSSRQKRKQSTNLQTPFSSLALIFPQPMSADDAFPNQNQRPPMIHVTITALVTSAFPS